MSMMQKPQSGAQFKLSAAARQAARHLPRPLPPVFVLTDPVRLPDPVAIAERLPRGWGIIYRHYGAAGRDQVARALSRVTRRRQLSFLVAADPDLALAVGADGVHWPYARRAEALKWRTRFALMTVSAHSSQEARTAARGPCSAVLLSTIFASNSPSARSPIGRHRLRTVARGLGKPVYGLGGVNAGNAGAIAGVAGLAGIEGMVARATRT